MPTDVNVKRLVIVVSGPPACGKSTIAGLLGEKLRIRAIDKDDFLERRLDSLEMYDLASRSRCSREADGDFEDEARKLDTAILVSYWRRPHDQSDSGTPSEWLLELDNLIEVACYCEPDIAVQRFTSRVRHAGHVDGQRSIEDLLRQMEIDCKRGPLGIGNLIQIDTGQAVDIEKLAADCVAAYGLGFEGQPITPY